MRWFEPKSRGGASSKRRRGRPPAFAVTLAVFACAAIGWPAASSADTTITIAPNSPVVNNNCHPFGWGQTWTPNAAFIYKNIPAFQLHPNDILAFDTGAVNEADIQLQISLAPTTANGTDVVGGPFTTVVTNGQTPSSSRGDTTPGNFDLQFRTEVPFSFPGGGLIIRFSNPSASYAADGMCTSNLVGANGTDTSGFFVKRAYGDLDGVDPWASQDAADIGAFRLTLLPPPPTKPTNVFSFGKVKRNKHKGTATLAVDVPGPGILSLTGDGVKHQRSAGATASQVASAAGTVNLAIKPKTKIKKKLKNRGKAKVKVSVAYTPTGGFLAKQSKRVKLVKKG